MKASIRRFDIGTEYFFDEGCYITETSNTPEDPEVSIVRARLEPGRATRLHRLLGTAERYVIVSGTGIVEVETLQPEPVCAGDVVLIPARCGQRITNSGADDLVFLAICTPRFRPEAYQDIEPQG